MSDNENIYIQLKQAIPPLVTVKAILFNAWKETEVESEFWQNIGELSLEISNAHAKLWALIVSLDSDLGQEN